METEEADMVDLRAGRGRLSEEAGWWALGGQQQAGRQARSRGTARLCNDQRRVGQWGRVCVWAEVTGGSDDVYAHDMVLVFT